MRTSAAGPQQGNLLIGVLWSALPAQVSVKFSVMCVAAKFPRHPPVGPPRVSSSSSPCFRLHKKSPPSSVTQSSWYLWTLDTIVKTTLDLVCHTTIASSHLSLSLSRTHIHLLIIDPLKAVVIISSRRNSLHINSTLVPPQG